MNMKSIYSVTIPWNQTEELSQDKEYCIVKDNEKQRTYKIGFHEYEKIYAIPGLYEYIFYDKLKCCSPEKVCSLIERAIKADSIDLSDLYVLELGAGNGMVGEELRKIGVKTVCGIDIEKFAEKAVKRDRPTVYKDYYVVDLTQLPQSLRLELNKKNFNCLVTVAALGFGGITPGVFMEGINLVSTPAWIAFNIKEDFLSDDDSTGFSCLIRKMIEADILDIRLQERYQHRLSIQGKPLYYIAMIGKKKVDIPAEWLS
ncbi:hypothetical protein [Desulfovulcanus sp.]